MASKTAFSEHLQEALEALGPKGFLDELTDFFYRYDVYQAFTDPVDTPDDWTDALSALVGFMEQLEPTSDDEED